MGVTGKTVGWDNFNKIFFKKTCFDGYRYVNIKLNILRPNSKTNLNIFTELFIILTF